MKKINDITTNLDHPLQFEKIKKQNPDLNYEYQTENREIQKLKHPKLEPLTLNIPIKKAYELVVETAKKMPRWKFIDQNPEKKKLEITATTLFMRYQDDVVIEIKEGQSELDVSIVHIRSKSRKGSRPVRAKAMETAGLK